MINTPNNRLEPQTWEEIQKIKWKGYKPDTRFEKLLDRAQFKLSPSLNALEGIYNRVQQHFSTNANPLESLPTHNNLYPLVISKELIRVSYDKLKKNKGALTPGSANITADSTSETIIENLHNSLKTNTFQWNPVNRIEIQKPGRAPGVKRPLDLPDFTDKLVQNNILMILSAIYEPEFEYVGLNYGFRPKKSTNSAIKKIRLENNDKDVAIEGDIVGAYDNMQHPIFIKILRKRIRDEKFLQLIYTALKAGFMKEKSYYDTFLGTPQGGIHSPILFNIYMNEFDKFIKTNIPIIIEKWNQPRLQYSTEANNTSRNLSRQILRRMEYINPKKSKTLKTPVGRQLIESYKDIKNLIPNTNKKKKIIDQNIHKFENTGLTPEEREVFRKYVKERRHNNKKLSDYEPNEQFQLKKANAYYGTERRTILNIRKLISEYNLQDKIAEAYSQIALKEIKEIKNKQISGPSKDPKRKLIKVSYYRYADDWILLIRGTIQTAKTLKKILKIWLLNNLKLELSPEKTLITDLHKEKAHFLGFEIFFQTNKQVIKRKISETQTALQRYGKLQIMPDAERIKRKFEIKNYITKEGRVLSVGSLTVLEDHQIIEKFNQFMIGIGVYYITEISRPGALNYFHYILYFACLKTLSHKHRSSIKKIINKMGYIDISKKNQGKAKAMDRRIVSSYKMQDGTIQNSVLLNYNEYMMRLKRIRDIHRNQNPHHSFYSPTIDFSILQKNNWRTKFKLTSMCAICASTELLEMHHIKHIKKQNNKNKQYKGFDKLVASLNRKQICVCRNCHHKIHRGEYDQTSLKDLIDIRIVAPESRLRADTNETVKKKTLNTQSKQITINYEKKTYFNSELKKYYETDNYWTTTNPEIETGTDANGPV
jgi:hypothetical protein